MSEQNIPSEDSTRQAVQDYYGKQLSGSGDLKTNACCTEEAFPAAYRKILSEIEPEILEKFYGCGSPIPPLLEGKRVLDLGCGTGRDVYLISRLVGPEGYVIGVDMTSEQLDVARKYVDKQTERFGYKKPNVDFRKGYIEDLMGVGILDRSIDVTVSNCVINLSTDKRRVFAEIFRSLKPGGELYFSDVFSDRRIPRHLQEDPVLYSECLSGALYIEDFRRILWDIGCLDYRVYHKNRITVNNPELKAKVGAVNFYSMTIRAFKLNSLEDLCEDYGQVAVYNGNIPEAPYEFELDDHHVFIAGKPMLVCGNTAAMLQETRFKDAFTIIGDRSTHFGPFDCRGAAFIDRESESGSRCC